MSKQLRRDLKIIAILLVTPAVALDMPARKPGLWELNMEFVGRKIPAQAKKQCVDAASNKLMKFEFRRSGARSLCQTGRRQIRHGHDGGLDCTFGDATMTTHAVVTGNFDSAYTVAVTSTREGGRPMPGTAAGGASRMTIAAKWLGPCADGQKSGDIIMANDECARYSAPAAA